MLDTPLELAIAGAFLLTFLIIILRFVRKGGHAKIGPVEVREDNDAPVPPATCSPYALEHAEALGRIEAKLSELTTLVDRAVDRINQNDEATGALIIEAGIVLKYIRKQEDRVRDDRDRINGDLDEATDEIDRASEVYRLGRKVGG